MADQSDVEKALIAAIAGALFPGAPYLMGDTLVSAAGCAAKVYRGWPEQANLDADLNAPQPVAHVSVFPEPGAVRNTTRYQPQAIPVAGGTPTLTASVSGATATFSGTGGAGQVAGIAVGELPRPAQVAAYRLTASDTPASVAAYFAGKFQGAAATDAAVTLATNLPMTARVVADVTTLTEVRRQDQRFRISCWCPTPQSRDALVSLIDATLAATPWLTMAEGSAARLIYATGYSDDKPSRDRVWRRDLIYRAEFPTTLTQTLPEMLWGTLNVLTPTGATIETLTG